MHNWKKAWRTGLASLLIVGLISSSFCTVAWAEDGEESPQKEAQADGETAAKDETEDLPEADPAGSEDQKNEDGSDADGSDAEGSDTDGSDEDGSDDGEPDTDGTVEGEEEADADEPLAAELEEEENSEEDDAEEEGIYLTWNVDSSITYELDKDDFVWTIQDENGKKCTEEGFTDTAKAGYEFAEDPGKWYGTAQVTLEIKNTCKEERQFRFLFGDELATQAAAVSETFEFSDNLEYGDGVWTIASGKSGTVTMTIDTEHLSKPEDPLSLEDSFNVGYVRIQAMDKNEEE